MIGWRLRVRGWQFIPCYIIGLLLSPVTLCNAQVIRLENVPDAFEKIDGKPVLYDFKNTGFKIPKGGHLQGIQGWSEPGDSVYTKTGLAPIQYVVITASSNTSSYYVTARLNSKDGEDKIIALQKLMASPFRHAGGCQQIEKKLLVGVEDNQEKDKSEILMVSLADSGKEVNAKTIIERHGIFKRSTAGAVGVTQIHHDHYLVAVGDWDSRNIDFYISRLYSGKAFDSLTTFHVPAKQKWPSYQSINLLSDKQGNLFLIAFCLDGNKNRADLFNLSLDNDSASLKLLKTKYFDCPKGIGFRYGAGIRISDDKQLEIYACQRKLGKHNFVGIFRYLPKNIAI